MDTLVINKKYGLIESFRSDGRMVIINIMEFERDDPEYSDYFSNLFGFKNKKDLCIVDQKTKIIVNDYEIMKIYSNREKYGVFRIQVAIKYSSILSMVGKELIREMDINSLLS